MSNIQTAKAIAKAYLLRVAVQKTYDLTRKNEIEQRIGDQLFDDKDVLHDLNKKHKPKLRLVSETQPSKQGGS